jgi:hypothetical protein
MGRDGWYEVAQDSGYISEPDDDPDLDPMMVGMARGDARWLTELIENEWDRRPLEPHEIPVYFVLRKVMGSEVSFDEWLSMQDQYPELREEMPPLGPVGTDREPPF